MNIREARSILGVSEEANEEEIKKSFRVLALKWHPDRCKEEGAEEKFKQINQAYQTLVSSNNEEDEMPQGFNPFGRQNQNVVIQAEHISLFETISFKESVLGCKREVSFQRKLKCQNCNGQGQYKVNNGCDKCGGRGQIVQQQNNMIFARTCDKCRGQTGVSQCEQCQATGTMEGTTSINVSIPGGVISGNVLRLAGMGNFIHAFMGMDQSTDAMLHLSVTEEPGLALEGQDVVSHLSISLLEALQGITKSVLTILGEKGISIGPLSKNKEEIAIPKLGVSGVGSHRVILDISYPADVSPLIEILNGAEVCKCVSVSLEEENNAV